MKTHSNLQEAVVSIMSAQRKKAAAVVTAEDILSLVLKRELRSAVIEGVWPDPKTIYFFHPPSIADLDAYAKHAIADGNQVSVHGIVAALIARARDETGAQLFKAEDAKTLMLLSGHDLMRIWNAFGEFTASPIESAEKK